MPRATIPIALLLSMALRPDAHAFTPQELWEAWPAERFVTAPAPCLRHAELAEGLEALEARHPGSLRLEKVGRSVQGRSIFLLTVGRGPRKILLWSQMHGDEPSATPALLDISDYLLTHSEEPASAAILEHLTLLMVPMLNPDGAQIYERRNAQGIDINRDALNLATPEGRILQRLRAEHEPLLGFNLHDQNRRTAVGDTGALATNAVLAVAGDPQGTLTPGRMRAKRACSAIAEALGPFMPGGMARYDEEWSPRAFGDNMTAWGTPVVLIESGGLPPGRPLTDLTRLNFVALLSTLHDLVRDDLAGHDPGLYDGLPRNRSDAWADVIVRGGFVLQPGAGDPYRADVAFDLLRSDRWDAGCAGREPVRSRVVEVGDGRFLGAGRELDVGESLVLAPFVVSAQGWSARRWLDGETLARLARLGVERVRWRVGPSRIAAARALAQGLGGRGTARLEVASGSSLPSGVVLTAPPPAPRSDSLAEVVASLTSGTRRRDLDGGSLRQALARLWREAAAEASPWPPIARGRPASFLLVAPASEGLIDAEETRITSVWIDGFEVWGKP